MGVAHVRLVHCDFCWCKVKGFCAISSNERKVQKKICKGCNKKKSYNYKICKAFNIVFVKMEGC